MDAKRVQLPTSEIDARKSEWHAGVVTSIDAAHGTLRVGNFPDPIPFAFARVVVAMQESVPERPQHFPVPFKDATP